MKFSLVSFAGGAIVTMILGGVLVAGASFGGISWPGSIDVSEVDGGSFAGVLRKVLVNDNLDNANDGEVEFASGARFLGSGRLSQSLFLDNSDNIIANANKFLFQSNKIKLDGALGDIHGDGELSINKITSSGAVIQGALIASGIVASGNMLAQGYYYSSDARLKHNIQDIPDPIGLLRQLYGVTFQWNDTKKQDMGLIAQDVEVVLPYLVQENQITGTKSVEYGNLVALLIEVLKEQEKRIVQLEKNQK